MSVSRVATTGLRVYWRKLQMNPEEKAQASIQRIKNALDLFPISQDRLDFVENFLLEEVTP